MPEHELNDWPRKADQRLIHDRHWAGNGRARRMPRVGFASGEGRSDAAQ